MVELRLADGGILLVPFLGKRHRMLFCLGFCADSINQTEVGCDCLAVLLGYIAQRVMYLVNDAQLHGGFGKLSRVNYIGLFLGFGDLDSTTAWKPSIFVIKISGYVLFPKKLGRAIKSHCAIALS